MKYYCITDPVEIRIMVLYALREATEQISRPQLTHSLLASADVDMFDICDAIAFLEKANEIYRFINSEGHEIMDLTDSGRVTVECFYKDIPLQVREYIVQTLKELHAFKEEQNRITASSVPVSFTEYSAQLGMRESEKDILKLQLYAKDEEIADLMCKNFKKKHDEIYAYLLKILTETEE